MEIVTIAKEMVVMISMIVIIIYNISQSTKGIDVILWKNECFTKRNVLRNEILFWPCLTAILTHYYCLSACTAS